MFRTLEISASGMQAQRTRMDTIAGNIAQASTTVDENGEASAFQRRMVILEAVPRASGTGSGGTAVTAHVEIDTTSLPREVYQPGHPQADERGIVQFPNIDPVTEFVNAIEASRAYEANINVMKITREMIDGTFGLIG